MAENKFSIIFSDLTDPRVDKTKRHKLLDIIGLTITAVLCGADNWVEVAEFGEIREEWLRTFLELPNGLFIPRWGGSALFCRARPMFYVRDRRAQPLDRLISIAPVRLHRNPTFSFIGYFRDL